MATDSIIDPNLPPEVAAEQQSIVRRRRLAEAMMQRGMTPIQSTNPRSPVSWTQGLAQIANAYYGAQAGNEADQQSAALGQRYQQGLADEVRRIAAMRQGTPASTENIVDEQANGGEGAPAQINAPAVAGNPKGAIEAALLSQYAPVRQMGVLEHKTYENEQTRSNDREARLQERIFAAEAKAADERSKAEERKVAADKAETLRRELATMQDTTRRYIAAQSDATRRDVATAAGKPPTGYRTKPDGSLEAIPGGPADVKAQALAQRQADGATDVDVALGTLRDAYDRLEKGGGVTSTKNGPLDNATASVASSGIGQAVGKLFGTQNQSARNDIAMARPALLASLMKATGMSARQMDSNAELKLWLSTATDPTLDVEANRRALNNIERKYLKTGPASTGGAGGAPAGVDPKVWAVMTPEERALWAK